MSKHRTHRTTWLDRLLSGVLCLALALGLLPSAGLIRTADAAHWATPYAEQLVEWGVMRPEWASNLGSPLTRAEFVAMCNRAFGYSRLGSMPFVDVPSSAWYAEDINIAYNAGYFSGTSANQARPKASPEEPLTREMAVVAVSINLLLQETVGESLGFTDSRELHEWSRGMVGAAVAEGVINGFPDGSFRPFENITRGEIAALLVGLIGTPLNRPGNYELGDVYGNVVISSSNVTLRDTVVLGNLYVTGGVDLGNVLLENVTVLGRIVVGGGGVSEAAQSSVSLCNVTADEMVIDSLVDQFVTVSAYGVTDIPSVCVRSGAYLEDSCAAGYGLHHIELDGESGTKLQLAGSIKEVVNKTPLSLLQLVKGTAETITVDEYAKGSQLLVDINTRVDTLNLDVATLVYGDGDIINLNIWAEGCEVEILPEHVSIRPGITAVINGEVVGSAAADELSSEPRLLPGYPAADSLRPNSAEGLYAGNKPGTIYWAVSAIADGSVSVENLIKNPVYGGNILKDGDVYQSGSITAGSRTEYGRLISGLEPDGSYYISSVLVDERGNRSPLKVVSFSTPDDTVPAFMDGYPRMSKTTCEIAQVNAMANKTCLLYWVLLPHGAAAPTAQNFKSSSFGGNYGFGSINVVKNVPVFIQVNSTRLQEKTGYDVYLWLNDLDGVHSSEVVKVLNKDTQKPEDPSFITPDEMPPIVTSIQQTNFNLPDAVEFSFEINEAPSTLHWFVVPATDNTVIKPTDDLTSQRVQMKVKNPTGSAVVISGKKAADGAYTETMVRAADFKNSMKYSTWQTHEFKLYYMAEDAEGNCSEVKYINIYTLDSDEPTVILKFDPPKYSSEEDKKAERNPRPLTNSNLILIFSEQVRGDEDDAKTFAELYSEVERYVKLGLTETEQDKRSSNPSNQLTKAKNALGRALEEHITLYYWKNSQQKEALAKPTGNPNTEKEYGWVDWREAIVTVNGSDGTVELTLTAGKAVQLGGGLSYYFFFENIYDNAHTPNPLKLTRADGEVDGGRDSAGRVDSDCYTDTFTTIFAQVWLQFVGDDTVSAVVGKKADGTDDTRQVRMDIMMDVIPDSLSSTASNAYWDMIMWCDTVVYFEIYRLNGTTWEKISDPIHYSPTTMNGASMNARLGIDPPRKIADSLEVGATYSYGIHFTSVNGVAETSRATEPAAWGDKVTMWFSMIAGSANNIKAVSNNVSGSFDADRNLTNGDVSEIGADIDKESESKLMGWYQFTNTEPPVFYSTYPQFVTKSNSVTMMVMTEGNRTGKLFYLAVPVNNGVPALIPKTGAGTEINGGNDRNGDIIKKDENGDDYIDNTTNSAEGKKTYVPTDGGDRDTNAKYIYYKTGADKANSEPTIDRVTTPTAFFPNAASAGFVWREEELDGVYQEIEIPDLKPKTKYYIYIVLKGSGDDSISEAVEIYQVTTKEAYPPVISISASGLTAELTTYDGAPISSDTSRPLVDSELSYALVSMSNLPAFLQYEFSWEVKNPAGEVTKTYSNVTLLNMLTQRTGSATRSPTLFDEYADVAARTATASDPRTKASDYKDDLMQFITNEGVGTFYDSLEAPVDTGTVDYRVADGPRSPVFKNVDEEDFEVRYGLLVFGRVAGAGDGTENYSFAAAQGLYLPDPLPPVFVPQTGVTKTSQGEVSYVSASPLKVYNGTEQVADTVWRAEAKTAPETLFSYTFSGDIQITFTRALYQYISITGQGPVRREVVTGTPTDTTKQVKFEDVISKPSHLVTRTTTDPDTGKPKEEQVETVKFSVTQTTSTKDEAVTFNIHFEGFQWNDAIMILGSGKLTNKSPAGAVSDYRLTLRLDPTLIYDLFVPEGTYIAPAMQGMMVGGFIATWAETK